MVCASPDLPRQIHAAHIGVSKLSGACKPIYNWVVLGPVVTNGSVRILVSKAVQQQMHPAVALKRFLSL